MFQRRQSYPRLFLICGLLIFLGACREKPADKHPVRYIPSSFQPVKTNAVYPDELITKPFDFVTAAKIVTPAVVHIKTSYKVSGNPFFDLGQDIPLKGSGSGVVISPDGYIATNNHVIADAKEIEVVFPDRKHFTAKLIGSDPNTDLALLKVDAKDLAYVPFGNSDDAQIGEWVLAVGYPFSLNTTATAGIISAKGRSIGIIASSRPAQNFGEMQASSAIESFIQTDAAINAGNSGGALVNTRGELIGINTAIASVTGSYAGYAFAVPIDLAKKILEDLKDFGTVQRGLLGISFPAPAVEDEYLKQMGIKPGSIKGVFITGIQKNSAADAAGLKSGDIIQFVDSMEIASPAEFSERIARHRPGDKVQIGFLRNGKQHAIVATLKAEEKDKRLNETTDVQEKLGAKFGSLPRTLKKRYNVTGGVVVTDVTPGGFFDQVGIPEGTVIVAINGKPVASEKDIEKAIESSRNSTMQILAVAPDGSRIAFNISLGT